MRIESHQGKFAAKLGISQNRQSFLEKGERELRADYLDQIAALGLDVQYIVTGRRGGELLPPATSSLIDSFDRLDADAQQAIVVIAAKLAAK